MPAATYITATDLRPDYIDGRGFREGAKGSRVEGVTWAGKSVVGGFEDCIDIVRGRDITLRDCVLYIFPEARTRTHLTAKGGIQGLHLQRLTFWGSPRWWNISWGDWTDYDRVPRPLSRGLIIEDCVRRDGRPITVLCRWAERPTVIRSRVRLLALPEPLHLWWHRLEWRIRRRVLRAPTHYEPDYSLRDYERRAMGERLKG